MMRTTRFSLVLAMTAFTAGSAQQQPPVRQIGAVEATAAESFGGMIFVRHTKNGVLVNDQQNRRVVMFDPALAKMTVVADTTPATANAYSGRVGSLVAYRADSSLFIDPQSMSMLVIDPEGKVGRVMSVPRTQDVMTLGNAVIGAPTYDGQGRLVYRAPPDFRRAMRMAGGGGVPTAPEIPDTMPIVRVDLTSRVVDTVGFIKVPRVKMDVSRDDNGRITMTSQMNPLPVVDEWAVLSDGSIAMVRGQDYHVDWLRTDGSRESTGKIPFDWRRLSDEDKVAFIDSVKAQRERMLASQPQPATTDSAVNRRMGPGGGGRDGGGAPGEVRVFIGGGGGAGPGGPGGPGGMQIGGNMNFVPANELPDYQPVFFAGAARADADGNLWIRTTPTKALTAGPIYDVINTKGALVDRVQVPKDRLIVGFGPQGVVYLAAREGTVTKLEKAKVK
jgi:hypothetical protein